MTKADKKKVLMLSTSYPVVFESVSGLFVGRLATALSEVADVLVVAPDACVGSSPELSPVVSRAFGYAPRRWQVLAHVPGGIPSQLKLNKLNYLLLPPFIISYLFTSLRYSKSIDVVHANWAFSSLIGWFVKKVRGVPLLTTLRGEDVRLSNGGLSGVVLKFSLWASDSVVVVSDEMLVLLRKYYPKYAHKCSVIHNGVSSSFFVEKKGSYFYSQSRLKLVYVGSLIARKNLYFIVDALSVFSRQGGDFEFNVVGDGPELAGLRKAVVRLGFEGRVSFLGQLPPEQVAEQVSRSHIYISSSLHEGRPNGVLEAMAAGCCCVLSDISGHRELTDEGRGIVFIPDSADTLGKILCDLDTKRDKIEVMGRKSQQFIEKNSLTWDACAETYDSVFDELIVKGAN